MSAVISDESFVVSKDDLLNLASQILEILYILFSNDLVLKNLHINDFMLRRTTRGFRAVLINQDFYTKYFSTEPPFTKQNQLHNRRFHVHFAQCNGREWYSRSFISFILQSPHSKTISSLSATFCALWRIDRFPGSVSPTPKSKKRKQPAKTSCDVAPSIQVSPFLFLFPLRTALHSPQSRRLARTAGPREGRHRVHRRERHHAADHAGRTSFFFFLLIPRSTCSKSKRKARFRGDSHL